MLCVFVILFFHDLFDPLCLFFCSSPFLGSLFGIHFRGRTFVFLSSCGMLLFQWLFAYVFALLFVFSLQDVLWKNSLDVRSSLFLRVAFWNPFSGANFCFSCLLVACCFLVVFCLCFFFIVCLFTPEHVLENSLDVRSSLF